MNKPKTNKTYMLVAGSNVKSIAAGNTWAEAEVKPALTYSEQVGNEREAMNNKVKAILSEIKKVSFVDDYDASDEEAFGLMMSKYFGWDGYAIAEAAGNALEDANFHGWAKILRDTELMDHVAKGGK